MNKEKRLLPTRSLPMQAGTSTSSTAICPALLSALQSHTKPTPPKKSYSLLGKTKANSILIPVITVASRFQMRCLMLKFWNVSSVRP